MWERQHPHRRGVREEGDPQLPTIVARRPRGIRRRSSMAPGSGLPAAGSAGAGAAPAAGPAPPWATCRASQSDCRADQFWHPFQAWRPCHYPSCTLCNGTSGGAGAGTTMSTTRNRRGCPRIVRSAAPIQVCEPGLAKGPATCARRLFLSVRTLVAIGTARVGRTRAKRSSRPRSDARGGFTTVHSLSTFTCCTLQSRCLCGRIVFVSDQQKQKGAEGDN